MQDFDRENGPTVADLKNSWKVKLAVAVVLLIAIGSMVYMDITGQVTNWR